MALTVRDTKTQLSACVHDHFDQHRASIVEHRMWCHTFNWQLSKHLGQGLTALRLQVKHSRVMERTLQHQQYDIAVTVIRRGGLDLHAADEDAQCK